MFTRCDLYHMILLYCYAETKEMIYESLNLKEGVYEPKQNSSSVHVKVLQTFARSFIKFIH